MGKDKIYFHWWEIHYINVLACVGHSLTNHSPPSPSIGFSSFHGSPSNFFRVCPLSEDVLFSLPLSPKFGERVNYNPNFVAGTTWQPPALGGSSWGGGLLQGMAHSSPSFFPLPKGLG